MPARDGGHSLRRGSSLSQEPVLKHAPNVTFQGTWVKESSRRMALDNTSGPFSYHELLRNPTPLPSRLRSPSVKDMWRG